MMTFIHNVKEAFSAPVDESQADRGGFVDEVLLIAGFAIVTLLLVNWIGTALLNKGADTAGCIEGANTYTSASSEQNCENQNHSSTNSFKNDQGYTSRFGSK